ncbi:hypothetical protein A9Q81_21220 [Gammaproteobacteria bacterium 42_54_T18]|nr:hypothetical protein A9Q81_21220 [Gammaproteobacteria bacterium 42_54_T18]
MRPFVVETFFEKTFGNALVNVLGGVAGKLFFVFVLIALMSGCKGNPQVEFTAEPETINAGEPSTLSWSVVYEEGATDITMAIEPDLGDVDLVGSVNVTPVETTEYTLTTTAMIKEALKTTTELVTVTVIPAPPLPEIFGFDFIQGDGRAGEPVELHWSVAGAESVSISPSDDVISVDDTGIVVFPMEQTTYTLTAENENGQVTAEVVVDVTFTDLNTSVIWPVELRQCVELAAEENSWQYNEQVTEVRCADKKIEYFSGIDLFNNLRVLDLSDNYIEDFYLSNNALSRLKELYLSGNAIIQVSSLSQFTELTHLDLSGNPILDQSDITNILNNNKNISHLLLNDIPLTDMYLSDELLLLEVLEIENSGIRDLSFVSGLSNLKELNVANNVLKNLLPLTQLQLLEILNVSSNFLKSLDGITQLNSLVSLDVSYNPNLEKSSLAGVINNNTGLRSLLLADLSIDSLVDLGGVFIESNGLSPADFQLKALNIDSTRMHDVSALVNQPSLVELSFRNNSIDVFPDFSSLMLLESLVIGDTGFDDYGLLLSVSGELTELDVSDNPLSGEFPFGDFVGLTSLEISGLGLSQLAGIELIVGLEKLNVSNNRLNGDAVAGVLSTFPGLTDLDVSENIISEGYLMFNQSDTLRSLNLSDMGIDGFSALYFPNLKILNISDNAALEEGGLSGVELLRLKELDVSHTKVTVDVFDLRSIKSLNMRGSGSSSYELASKLGMMPLLETLIFSDLNDEGAYQDSYSLFQSIQQPLRLRKLDVGGMYRDGPLSLHQFSNLRWLNVQGSDYSVSDSSISELDALYHLDMSNTRLVSMVFPENIHELILAGNTELVGELSAMTTLTQLDVSGDTSMDTHAIRQAIENSPAIKNINVSNLGLENLSDVISSDAGSSKIEFLNLSQNHITHPGDLSLFLELKVLSINDNPISDLTFVNQLHNLEYLDVSHTYSTLLPAGTELKKLKHLDVSYLPITETETVFSQIVGFSQLSYLDLSGIDLRDQYLWMLNVLPLETLKLAGTHIDSADFYQWDGVEVLDLSNNNNLALGEMPSGLRELYLRNSTGFNSLSGGLDNLKALDVSYTDLRFDDVQSTLSDTKQLHTLGIAGIDVPDYFSVYDIIGELGDSRLSLRYLDISNLSISGWEGLDELVGLERLIAKNMTGGYITFDLTGLVELDLSGSEIDPNNITPFVLNNLGLKVLRLNDIDLSGTDVLSALEQNNTQLVELELRGAGISQLLNGNEAFWGGLNRLNVSGNHLTELPFGLMSPVLQYLDISHNNIADLTGVPPGLKVFDAGFNPIENANEIANMIWLTSLSLSNTNVSDVGFLFNFQFLERLDLSAINIVDKEMLIAAIAALQQLQELNLAEVNLVGSNPYNVNFDLLLPNLRILNLSDTGLVDISLDQYLLLTSLDVSHNPISSLSGYGLQLEMLNVSHTFLSEIPVSMDSMKSLYVGYSQMNVSQVLDSILNKGSLLALDIAGLKRDDIYWQSSLDSFGGDFGELEYLDVSNMGVTDFGWVSGYESLTTLKAANNFISQLWGLEQHNLRSLDLSGNPITAIAELETVLINNPYLESIGLNDISLNNLDFFGVLDQFNEVAIKELKLSNTGLLNWDVQNLSKYQMLEHLEIANNKLQYVPSLALFPDLAVLDISGNSISDVFFVVGEVGKPLWKFLDVSNNPIDGYNLIPLLGTVEIKGLGVAGLINVEGLQQWSGLSQLTYLDLSNTGLSTFDVSSIPNLQVLKIANNYIEGLDLSNAYRLKELDVANNRLSDDFVFGLPMHIQRLNLSNNAKLNSLDHLGYMESIIELRLSGLRLEQTNLFNWQGSLSQKAHQVRVLDISSTDLVELALIDFQYLKELNVSDTIFYSPFYGLNQAFIEKLYIANIELDSGFSLQGYALKELDVSGYSGGDLSGVLSGVGGNGLTALYINNVAGGDWAGGDISDTLNEMYPIYELRGVLRTLELDDTNISDLSLLDGFVNLEAVSLRDNQISDIAVLSQYQNLNSIDVYGNQLMNVSPLHNLFGLRSLDIGKNSGIVFSDIDVVLQNNPEITVLGLNGVMLGTTDFSLTVSLRLSLLDIGNTGITQFNAAGSLLQSLNISENDIQVAPGIPQLKKLNISNSKLTDIFGLIDSSRLTHLDISGNSLISLPDLQLVLSNQTDLVSINVSELALMSFSDLGLSTAWETAPLVNLDLSGTGISELWGVEQFTSLRTLNLSGNPAVDCSYVDTLNWPGLVITRPAHCPVM